MKQRIIVPLLLLITTCLLSVTADSQTAQELIDKVRTKLNKVNDYEADGKMKTNVIFIKAPIATVKIYYKKPDRVSIKNEKGISFIPKGSMNISLANLFPTAGSNQYDLIDIGKDSTSKLRIIKLLPRDENAEVSMSVLHIDEVQAVIRRAEITTDNGKYDLQMTYGKYTEYGLADKVIFTFKTENFKLPKGVTMDYDDGASKTETPEEKERKKKGRVEITYSKYQINKGVPDAVFQ
jgi:hypothetical protein